MRTNSERIRARLTQKIVRQAGRIQELEALIRAVGFNPPPEVKKTRSRRAAFDRMMAAVR